ncbi:TBC domain-containing protein kinase-like protein [Bacillus rossius redtenbacheri]|uniref:TBC domain-containing protein kinase-like protein n=1 Tax=Bacillus rossius redtenbacheri TaxID=93214 RepID=UPI002FDE1AE4
MVLKQTALGTSGPEFGAQTFFARSHAAEMCGSNGLPLTPNSITIYGRAQILKTLDHPNLCSYLDVIRGKHERTILVSHYNSPLTINKFEVNEIIKFIYQMLSALDYLNKFGIVHRNLNPGNILFAEDENFKLFNYGLYFMTGCGQDVKFPIGHPKYLAPEVYAAGLFAKSGPKVDVWAVGLIAAELALGKEFWAGLKLSQWMKKILNFLHVGERAFESLLEEHACSALWQQLPSDIQDFVMSCLRVSPKQRLLPKDLLRHKVFESPLYPSLSDRTVVKVSNASLGNGKRARVLLFERKPQELYYLWQLAGGDVQSELKKQGLIRTKAPILNMPDLVLLEGTVFGIARDQTMMLDLRVVKLSLASLYQRLEHLPPHTFFPLIEIKSNIIQTEELLDAASLPLVIRERDTEYQFHRVVLYDRLLKCYPYKKATIVKEAAKDIPPFVRGDTWAALLGIAGDVLNTYIDIDKETPTHTDRQIEVDIPRCHQYDELLSSSEGHRKFKRVLKAWVVSHPQYVYWQGLDSLCAPFLYLNFNKEHQAYACLSAFIPKYLHNFFLKDNSAVIQEYLAKFSHLIAFHDPALANHLAGIGFVPELFAIPWFLTMFSHVFPLHKILHLWDRLLLGDASFPLHVGVSLLHQLRDTLLASGFNECILLFSDLPEVDMERCVLRAAELYERTPRSVTYRQHELGAGAGGSDLGMGPVPLAELRAELVPRISAADVLLLMDHERGDLPRMEVALADVRPGEEFRRGAIAGSLSVPPGAGPCALRPHRGKVIVVVGSDETRGVATEFSRQLVAADFPHVCVLHRGIQAMRSANVLVVQSAL